MKRGGERVEHPSFGAISIGTVTGRTHLFMSEAEHSHYVHITLHTAYMERDLSNDHMYADKQLISVHVTYAQWAEFLSSMGQGNGVPCTISYRIGEGYIPSPPPPRNKADKFRKDMREHLDGVIGRVDVLRERVRTAITRGSAPRKGDLTDVEHELAMIRQEMAANLPFIARQFQDSVEETLSAARIEADAYLARRTQELGQAALAERYPSDQPPALQGAMTPVEAARIAADDIAEAYANEIK